MAVGLSTRSYAGSKPARCSSRSSSRASSSESSAIKDRKSTRLNSSHSEISYAAFCLTKHIIDVAPGGTDLLLSVNVLELLLPSIVPDSNFVKPLETEGH